MIKHTVIAKKRTPETNATACLHYMP